MKTVRILLIAGAATLMPSCTNTGLPPSTPTPRIARSCQDSKGDQSEQQRRRLIDLIRSLPAYNVHNASPDKFRKYLDEAEFCIDMRGECALFTCDEGVKSRAFFLPKNGDKTDLRMIVDTDISSWRQEFLSEFYHYNTKTGRMECHQRTKWFAVD